MGPFARRQPAITDYPIAHSGRVSVIVPARNEAVTIDALLDSVLHSAYPDLEIIVVDDESTDDTRARVLAHAEAEPRLRLVAGTAPPPGWLGKPWACHQGNQLATGEFLLFTDADTLHRPTLIGHALGGLAALDADLLTLTSDQVCVTFWERVVMPQIWALLAVRYPPRRVNRATQAHQVAANGQFLLFRRDCYQAIGGHAAVAGEVVEDIALAQLCFRTGKRVRMLFGEALISTRMYRSLAELLEGWSKNLAIGARQSAGDHPWLAALAPFGVMAWLIAWLVPPVLLVAGLLPSLAALAILWSIAFWAAVIVPMRIPAWYIVCYPIGAAMALAITIRSTWRGGRRVEWRGRRYRVAR